ncbi:hypothetical protein SCG7086_AR_00210 [Chlamydiales bacterium SCGC AG-110-P3]|nr:hypothetical protein SCG7086_AR_00210 [Chlamydiales bacterium SCGC AG-110-P3]
MGAEVETSERIARFFLMPDRRWQGPTPINSENFHPIQASFFALS